MRFPNLFRRSRKPKHDRLAVHLIEQSHRLIEGAQAVAVYLATPTAENAQRVREIEQEADAIRRRLIAQLKRSFITPIDREDLFDLSRVIDDVLDYMLTLTRDMQAFEVSTNVHITCMVEVLVECAHELHSAVENIEHNPDKAVEHTIHILKLENRMGHLYTTALADLFKDMETSQNMVDGLKTREIYRHLIHTIQSAENAANLINEILVKFH